MTARVHTQPVLRYTGTAISLHWLMALLIVAGFTLGLVMTGMKMSPDKLRFYSWHKWLGVTVFLLAWLRVFWRLTHPTPPLPPDIPGWQAWVSKWSHGLLYVLLFAVPLSGWLYSSASGYQTVYLGLFPIPDLIGKDEAFAERLETLHEVLTQYVLLPLVLLHLAAALKHHFVDRDGLLRRMWFGRSGAAVNPPR